MENSALLNQAIGEFNTEAKEQALENFKNKAKEILFTISKNNTLIVCLNENNDKLKKQLTELELQRVNDLEVT